MGRKETKYTRKRFVCANPMKLIKVCPNCGKVYSIKWDRCICGDELELRAV